jgi:hypothetical protein
VPSLDLRFADNKSLTDAVTGANLVTFTRASDGTFVDSAGVLQTAVTDVPRFDHNPTTLESLGLLVEEQRANLLLNSEDFSGATTFRGSITANVIAAPDGATTADLFTENTETGSHTTQFGSVAFTTGVTYTVSIFLRPNGRDTNIRFKGTNTTTFAAEAFFNLTGNGAVASTVSGTASIQTLPNGWYRCIITGVSGATATTGIQVITSSGAGDNTSGIYFWGAQLEAGAFPTSYIPTTAAAVTRSADVCSITGSAFSSWYRQSEGSFFSVTETLPGVTATNRFIHEVNTGIGSASDKWDVRRTGSTAVRTTARIGGASTSDRTESLAASVFRAAAGADTAGVSLTVNGGSITPVANTVGTMPVVTQMQIGNGGDAATLILNGTIRRLCYWPQRLANSTLQQITQ